MHYLQFCHKGGQLPKDDVFLLPHSPVLRNNQSALATIPGLLSRLPARAEI